MFKPSDKSFTITKAIKGLPLKPSMMLFEDGRSIVFLANYRGEDVNEGQRQLRSTIYGLLGDD